MARELGKWVNTAEAAELTGYSKTYMRQLAQRRLVRARKVSRDWLIDSESLLDYKAKMDRLGPAKHDPWR